MIQKRNSTRIGAFLVTLIMLAGCATTSAPPAAPAPAPAAKPSLKIGVLLPYSKVYAALGETITNGMTLYFDSVGWTTGGRKIELIKEDEENDAQVSIRKAVKMIEQDKVDMITGVVATPVAYALRDTMHNSKTIFIVSNAGGNKLTREMKSPYVFRTSFTSWQISYPFGEWVAKNFAKEVYITAADYGFGRESSADFKASFTAAGGTVVGDAYPKLGNDDYGPYLAKIKDANPKATFHFYSGSDSIKFVQQWEQFGLSQIPLLGTGFLLDQDTLSQVGKAALGGLSSLHWSIDLDNAANKKFVADYQAKFKKLPDVFALQGYDTARVIVDAVNKANGDTANKEALIKVMEGITFDSPRGPFAFEPETHQVINNIYVRKVVKVGDEYQNQVLATITGVKDPGK